MNLFGWIADTSLYQMFSLSIPNSRYNCRYLQRNSKNKFISYISILIADIYNSIADI